MYDAKSCVRSIERVDQADVAGRSHQRRGRIHLDHRQPSPGGGDRVTLTGVQLFANAELVDLLLPGLAVDDPRRCTHAHLLRLPRTPEP